MLPERNNTGAIEHTSERKEAISGPSLEESLSRLLSKIDGAGEVKVFVTVSQGEQIIYQTDLDTSKQVESSVQRVSTILVTDKERNETGLIKQRIGAIYQGAVVLCRGADNPSVKLAVTDAVAKVTGLGSDKICVLKMK